MRPDVHHCCLRDRQVKRMLRPAHPPPAPFAVCNLLSHPLSTTQSAVQALGRDYRQLTGLRASVGRALDAGARPTALVCWLPEIRPPSDSHWTCTGAPVCAVVGREGGGGVGVGMTLAMVGFAVQSWWHLIQHRWSWSSRPSFAEA